MLTLPPVLTHSASATFVRRLPAAQSQLDEWVIDASALQQFDSSALAVLLACRRLALAAGKNFSVQGMPARLCELAALYGVQTLIPTLTARP